MPDKDAKEKFVVTRVTIRKEASVSNYLKTSGNKDDLKELLAGVAKMGNWSLTLKDDKVVAASPTVDGHPGHVDGPTSKLRLDLALDPVRDFLPLKPPRAAHLEAGSFACRSELVGNLLIDLEKLRHLPDRQNYIGHGPAIKLGRGHHRRSEKIGEDSDVDRALRSAALATAKTALRLD